MPVAGLVVEGGAVLERLLDVGEGDVAHTLGIGFRGVDGELEGVEGDAGVAADGVG